MDYQLAIDMVDGLASSTSIQEGVRNTLEVAGTVSQGLDTVCAAVAEFKGYTEENMPEDAMEAQGHRKRVNNLINDVSRICREMTGKSIRCTSRKGGYVYEALEPAPRTSKTIPAEWTTPTPAFVEDDDRSPLGYDQDYIKQQIKSHPLSVLDTMLDVLGDRFTDTLREVVDLRGR